MTAEQQRALEAWARGRRTPVRPAQRAKIVLLAAQGRRNRQIAAELHVDTGGGRGHEPVRDRTATLFAFPRLIDRDSPAEPEIHPIVDKAEDILARIRRAKAVLSWMMREQDESRHYFPAKPMAATKRPAAEPSARKLGSRSLRQIVHTPAT